ncbi:MAG: beta-lactamase family protein [Deltaproteobacteria bacterium]|nr:beta-lactamase family protein [Deltaproteobacteria bacterium]
MQTTSIDDLLRHAAEAGDVPGVVAMATTAHGLIYSGAFGRRWLPDGPPMTSDTIFWIASMTKAITSAAAMILVEQGKLSLDDPIRKVLPELAAPQVLEGFSPGGEPKLRPAERAITLRHLLAHTSGFGYHFLNSNLLRYLEVTGTPDLMTCKNASLNLPLSFDPGDSWEYGIGIDWAGKAIERVSGHTLQDYFDGNLFGPLSMTDTAFKLTEERRIRLAGMHMREGDGSLSPIQFELPQEPEFQMGGGGLYGTASDYLAFEQMFLRQGRANGRTVLSQETVGLMGQNQIGALQMPRWESVIPSLSNNGDFFPGMVKKWSLAFMLNTEPVAGGRSANSMAWAGLFNTYYWIDPAKQIAGIIMTQILPFLDSKVLDLFDRFEKAIYAAL